MPMHFPYLKAARVKLQERKNACIRANYQSGTQYIKFFLDFLRNDPVIKTIAFELSRLADQKFSDTGSLVDEENRRLRLPATETDCAAFYLRALDVLADPSDPFPHFHSVFGKGSNRIQDGFDDFLEQVLNPLCSYIDERIDDGDLLLYTLSRYQRECDWFEAGTLRDLVEGAESRKLEEQMDKHLRAWLFREGIDFPFSKPRSPSGEADVVVWQGETPLPIEVKVFDGENRDAGHVKQGLWQAHRYAADYSQPFGYLVVFNTSPFLLSFEGSIAQEGPPCVPVGDRSVFAITINVGTNRPSASKEKPVETKVISAPTP
ncbi:MAG: hypothetical protein O3C40_22130 [Planctomycetota bacterium]|nr:hypothetical protein [Planctomycetota bacterium]